MPTKIGKIAGFYKRKRRYQILKSIAIIGSESTGKSQLAEALAMQHNCAWIPEYARTYVEELQRPYTYADVELIARHQIAEETEILSESQDKAFVFFDTDLIITKVWFEHVYAKCPLFVTEHLHTHPMDFYLLCLPDLPWVPDSVRENGDQRDFFTTWYRQEIEHLGRPYAVVSGIGEQRIRNAEQAIDQWIKAK